MMAKPREKDLKTLMDARSLEDSIKEISVRAARDLKVGSGGRVCVVGIKTRGEPIARRMAEFISEQTGTTVPVGVVDITFYRDDIGKRGKWPEVKGTEMPFSVEGLNVLVVDDVIFTGRTARAAIEAVTDYGRPARIRLAVIVDRGGREFPIQPDYCALRAEAGKNREIALMIEETDGAQGVFTKQTGGS